MLCCLFLLEGYDCRVQGDVCILDQQARVHDALWSRLTQVVRDRHLQRQRARASLPAVTGGFFIAVPDVDQVRAMVGRPASTEAQNHRAALVRDLVRTCLALWRRRRGTRASTNRCWKS